MTIILNSRRWRAAAVGSAAVLAAALPAYALPSAASTASETYALAEVSTTSSAERSALLGLGLDVLEIEADGAEVLLHGQADVKTLQRSGLEAEYEDVTHQVAEMGEARALEASLQEQVDAEAAAASGLPTGRVSYRTIEEANAEIRQIAAENPRTVKLFEMPNTSLLGRPILGLEISHDVQMNSGKPVLLVTGVHHSREWPTLELTLELAWDVVGKDGEDPEITRLLDETRLVVVPVVNPDGFDMSRDRVQEMKRKNCRVQAGVVPTEAECANPLNHPFGVDLNRNYGAFWGGPGSSANVRAENHHGAAPYSEPAPCCPRTR